MLLKAMQKKYEVTYTHLEGGQPATQVKAEKEAIEKIMRTMHKRFPDQPAPRFIRSMLKVDASQTMMPVKQLPAWFMHLVSMVSNTSTDEYFDEVHLGYVLNDDAAYACVPLAAAFEHLCKAIYGLEFNPPRLVFPVLRFRKGALLELIEQYKLEDVISYCELPQLYDEGWRPCGLCAACYRHLRIRADWKNANDARYLGHRMINYDQRTKQQPAELETSTIDELRRLAEAGPIEQPTVTELQDE
jgi:7-cyano-7-deazaguanine synthase in queuosine biosynthesis